MTRPAAVPPRSFFAAIWCDHGSVHEADPMDSNPLA
jgi:hypothetical protein